MREKCSGYALKPTTNNERQHGNDAARFRAKIVVQPDDKENYMKYCSTCGAPVSFRTPAGDHLPRHVCDLCGEIHYLNPKVIVGALPVWEDRVLLCRRAIEPRHGLWTLPAGFMENGETTAQGAMRETQEEANARIELQGLYTLVNLAHISQVHILYRARLLDLNFFPGEETLEIALFKEEDIPWQAIAFRSIALTLQHFFADRKRGVFEFRTEELTPIL